jgi:hypothetical protein
MNAGQRYCPARISLALTMAWALAVCHMVGLCVSSPQPEEEGVLEDGPNDPHLLVFIPCVISAFTVPRWSVWPIEHSKCGATSLWRLGYKRYCASSCSMRSLAMGEASYHISRTHRQPRGEPQVKGRGWGPRSTAAGRRDPPTHLREGQLRWLQTHNRHWGRPSQLSHSHSWPSEPEWRASQHAALRCSVWG